MTEAFTNDSGWLSTRQSGIELLCLFCHILSARISHTVDDGFQSGSNSNANGKQLLFLGRSPPVQSPLTGDVLINLTGLSPGGITASYLPERLWNYPFQPTITFSPADDVRRRASVPEKSSFIQTRLHAPLAKSPIICRCEQETNKQTSWERARQIGKKHVDELMNVGQGDQTCRDEGEREEVAGVAGRRESHRGGLRQQQNKTLEIDRVVVSNLCMPARHELFLLALQNIIMRVLVYIHFHR